MDKLLETQRCLLQLLPLKPIFEERCACSATFTPPTFLNVIPRLAKPCLLYTATHTPISVKHRWLLITTKSCGLPAEFHLPSITVGATQAATLQLLVSAFAFVRLLLSLRLGLPPFLLPAKTSLLVVFLSSRVHMTNPHTVSTSASNNQ